MIGFIDRLLQFKVERDGHGVPLAIGHGQQPFPGRERKVVVGERVVAKIDLGRQLAVPRRLNEEVDVGGAFAMPADRLHQLVGGAVGRDRIALGHFGIE